MAAVDYQIQLAEQIAEELPEVSRNEWMRWMGVVEKHGLDRAIQYAEQLSHDDTLRPAIRRANSLIAQAVKSQRNTLKRLQIEECSTVLGYVAWWLRIKTLRGSLRSE